MTNTALETTAQAAKTHDMMFHGVAVNERPLCKKNKNKCSLNRQIQIESNESND